MSSNTSVEQACLVGNSTPRDESAVNDIRREVDSLHEQLQLQTKNCEVFLQALRKELFEFNTKNTMDCRNKSVETLQSSLAAL